MAWLFSSMVYEEHLLKCKYRLFSVGSSVFAVALVCSWRKLGVYLRDWCHLTPVDVLSQRAGCMIFGSLKLICSLLHHKVNFEKGCDTRSSLSGSVFAPFSHR